METCGIGENDKKATRLLLDLYKQESFKSNEQKSDSNYQNRGSLAFNQFPDLRQFTNPKPLE
jgi:hypothetical protein